MGMLPRTQRRCKDPVIRDCKLRRLQKHALEIGDRGENVVGVGRERVALRGNQQLLASDLGDAVGHDDYVITDDRGKRLDPDRLSREFQRIRKIAGLPHLTLHGLRHTGNSYLLANGANIKLIAERMGHSDPNITLRIYSHILPAAHIGAADMLDRQLS